MTVIPYDVLAHEAWARLAQAADDPTHPMRLFLLATVDADGVPDARLMVLRGAGRRLGKIWFYTDRRSEKVDQLRKRPELCAVAYDRRDGVQLRLRGAATIHELNSEAAQHWSQTSTVVRALYASPDAPGRPLRLPDPRLMTIKHALDAGAEAVARQNFAVIETLVQTIEWLQLKDDDQRRAILHASTGWAVQPLAP